MQFGGPLLVSYCRTILAFEGAATGLYFGSFTFFLLDRGVGFGTISWIIGSTALAGVFIGPRAGRFVDRFRNKWKLLAILNGVLSVSLTGQVLLFSSPSNSQFIILFSAVGLFSVCYNPATLLAVQYVAPRLSSDINVAFSDAERISSASLLVASLLAFFLYDRVGPQGIILIAALLFLVISLLSLSLHLSMSTLDSSSDASHLPEQQSAGTLEFISRTLKANIWILIPILAVAASIDAISANAESLFAYVSTVSNRWIFLIAVIQAAVATSSAHIYRRYVKNGGNYGPSAYRITLLIFALNVFSIFVAGLISESVASFVFLALGFLLYSFASSWWGIISTIWIRGAAQDKRYAETSAAFRLPRAFVTFLGVGTVGLALDAGAVPYLLMSVLTLIFALSLLSFVSPQTFWIQISEHTDE